jgi:putative ABC transport system permease protein
MKASAMFAYFLDLALRSLKRSKALTALMVIAIAMGIAASMTTLTIYATLAGDPLPAGRSGKLFHVQLDPQELKDYTAGEEPDEQLTRFDAEALAREARGERQALMTGGRVALTPDAPGTSPFFADARYTSADFFAMFGAPLLYGRAWSAADDAGHERVAVISKALNQRLFAGADSTGRSLRVNETAFRVIGVVDDWRPTPYFFDLNVGSYRTPEDVMIPFSTAMEQRLARSGSLTCWGNKSGPDKLSLTAACTWIQYWVELGTAEKVREYRAYLERYSEQQRAAGRFERPANVRLRPVMDWLAFRNVVPGDAKLQVWLAFGFLLVCLVNTVGLLLAKCLRRAPEIGVRRALGASKRAIFAQYLVEAGLIGVLGGVLGLVLAAIGFALVRGNALTVSQLVPVDWPLLLGCFVLEIVATLIAGLLPAWRACQITPALQLKSQ